MLFWMTLWTTLLIVSVATFCLLLLIVGAGALGELRESLSELRQNARQTREHPEILDEPT